MTATRLSDLFDDGTFLAPRLMEEAARWTPGNAATYDFSAGAPLSFAGDMPVLAPASTVTPDARALLQDFGHQLPDEIEPYEDRATYVALAGRRIGAGQTPAFIYPNPPGVFAGATSAVPNDLLATLNNKARMADYTPAGGLAPRRPARRLLGLFSPTGLPFVLKVATDEPNASGLDVAICRTPKDVLRAAKRFRRAPEVWRETFLEFERNWCLQYAIGADAEPEYIGASEQICGADGRQYGNFMKAEDRPTAAAQALGLAIAKNAAAAGYRGLAGFDILQCGDVAYAIDLNFRPVSSAGFVVHKEKLFNGGAACARLALCGFDGPLARMPATVKHGLDAGWLFPLAAVDGAANSFDGRSICHFALLGEAPDDIDRREGQLASSDVGVFGRKQA